MTDLIDRQAAIEAQPKQDREFIKLTVRNSNGRPYYSIIYLEFDDNGVGHDFEGYSSYSLDVISDYLKKYFMLSAQPEQRWIPVEDEPPKEKKTYWICTQTGYQCECRWTNNVYGFRESDKWGWSIFDIPQYARVVAYMPLPEPWKGEDNATD